MKAKLVDASKYGVWSLTVEGEKTKLSHEEALLLFKEVHKQFPVKKESAETKVDDEIAPEEAQERVDHRLALLEILQSLSPGGFEKICQRLLRESGFQHVAVTGKSGDGGIDGDGILEVNPFVSFKVLFQCKRFANGPVSSGHVRDFRGAMMGRADKGIIITTGAFTAEAQRRLGVMACRPWNWLMGRNWWRCLTTRLGLTARLTFDVDEKFFEAFR